MSDDITLFTDSSSTNVQPPVQNCVGWPSYPTYPIYPTYPTTTTDYTWAWAPPLTKEDIREVVREELLKLFETAFPGSVAPGNEEEEKNETPGVSEGEGEGKEQHDLLPG